MPLIIIKGPRKSAPSSPAKARPRTWYRGTTTTNVVEAIREAAAAGGNQADLEFAARRVTSGLPRSKYPDAMKLATDEIGRQLNALPEGVSTTVTRRGTATEIAGGKPAGRGRKK